MLDVNMDDLINSLRELKRQYDENAAAMETRFTYLPPTE